MVFNKILGNRKKKSLDELAKQAAKDDKYFIDRLLTHHPKKKERTRVVVADSIDFKKGVLLGAIYNKKGLDITDFKELTDKPKSAILCKDFSSNEYKSIYTSDKQIGSMCWNGEDLFFIDFNNNLFSINLFDKKINIPSKIGSNWKSVCYAPNKGLFGLKTGGDLYRLFKENNSIESEHLIDTREYAFQLKWIEEISCFAYVSAKQKSMSSISYIGNECFNDSEVILLPDFVMDYTWVPELGLVTALKDGTIRHVLDVECKETSLTANHDVLSNRKKDSKNNKLKISCLEWIPNLGLLDCGSDGFVRRLFDGDLNHVDDIILNSKYGINSMAYIPKK
ncbi:hypothetical protein HOK51_07535 [Candidatus Woesearchaeota archaeon]|jgi:hypothetical protein|nr:hypothetical protein [Candidatus Woesearchaeota archaeon]MBT6519675.1 hypothetical protein [Candidatus Woesearchaeota archaeon]MBT7367366.1 hypothetical protein [Candidatus Woesearchaeota archaeon]